LNRGHRVRHSLDIRKLNQFARNIANSRFTAEAFANKNKLNTLKVLEILI